MDDEGALETPGPSAGLLQISHRLLLDAFGEVLLGNGRLLFFCLVHVRFFVSIFFLFPSTAAVLVQAVLVNLVFFKCFHLNVIVVIC